MIKLLILTIGAAAVAASAATAFTQKSGKTKKDSPGKLPEQDTSPITQTYNEPVVEEYEADYMFI